MLQLLAIGFGLYKVYRDQSKTFELVSTEKLLTDKAIERVKKVNEFLEKTGNPQTARFIKSETSIINGRLYVSKDDLINKQEAINKVKKEKDTFTSVLQEFTLPSFLHNRCKELEYVLDRDIQRWDSLTESEFDSAHNFLLAKSVAKISRSYLEKVDYMHMAIPVVSLLRRWSNKKFLAIYAVTYIMKELNKRRIEKDCDLEAAELNGTGSGGILYYKTLLKTDRSLRSMHPLYKLFINKNGDLHSISYPSLKTRIQYLRNHESHK